MLKRTLGAVLVVVGCAGVVQAEALNTVIPKDSPCFDALLTHIDGTGRLDPLVFAVRPVAGSLAKVEKGATSFMLELSPFMPEMNGVSLGKGLQISNTPDTMKRMIADVTTYGGWIAMTPFYVKSTDKAHEVSYQIQVGFEGVGAGNGRVCRLLFDEGKSNPTVIPRELLPKFFG